MGRHVNPDVEVDALPYGGSGAPATPYPASGHPLQPQSVISPDTHVGIDVEVAPGTPAAAPSPADPDALIRHGLVGDGTELA